MIGILTQSSLRNSWVGSSIYSGKLDLNISLPLSDYCSMLQAEVIYPFIGSFMDPRQRCSCVSIFSDSQAVMECRRCLDLLYGRFTSVTLVWNPGHYNIPGNCRADELRTGALLPESSSLELGVPLA